MSEPLTVPVVSIIIPAYNEELGIARCLAALAGPARALGAEVIVAANGCRDATVAVASQFPGVRVLDIPEPSKTGALNAADAVATASARIYLDADVVLEERALRSMVAALDTEEPRLCAPSVRFDTSESDAVVKAFYSAHRLLPSPTEFLVGRGVYGLSRAGRQRFAHFPAIQGDDLFVYRLFAADETVLAEGHSVVRPARGWRDLVKVRTRIASGNAELARAAESQVGNLAQHHDFTRSSPATVRALGRLAVRQPATLGGIAAFVGVTLLARLRAHFIGPDWQRDASTR